MAGLTMVGDGMAGLLLLMTGLSNVCCGLMMNPSVVSGTL